MKPLHISIYHLNPLTTKDRYNLDRLIGTALVDAHVRRRLLEHRDEALLADFDLNESTRKWVLGIKASSLDELARVICTSSSLL